MSAVLPRWSLALIGLAAFALLALVFSADSIPRLPPEIVLQLRFPEGIPERNEPIVSAGVEGHADFIAIEYTGKNTATFNYDYWGFGGPHSAPVAFEPGSRHTLRLAMPAFTQLRGDPAPPPSLAPVRLEFDGREILNAPVRFHLHTPDRIFFAENPVGGTTAGRVFRGDIYTAEQRRLRGSPAVMFSRQDRLVHWLKTSPWQIAIAALLALAAAFAARWLSSSAARFLPDRVPVVAVNPARPHRWFAATTLLCGLAFTNVITGGTYRLIFEESFTSFYDYQAASFLAGRLDVPEPAVSAEAFVFEGKRYGYFGPTPALLRLPFAALHVAPGQLSRCYLLAYFVACLAAVYALLIYATRQLGGPSAWPARRDVVLFVGSAGLGSTLFFLSSRAYIYHEAILCGVAFALWSSWGALHWLARPASRWWLGALLLGTLAVHSRPPVGLFALTFLGCVAALHLFRARAADPRPLFAVLRSAPLLRPAAIGLGSVLGVLTFNGLSYLKFRSFDGAPLKYHVQYHPERLAVIEGKNFHLSNLRYNFDGYIWRPNFVVRPIFPYFYIVGRNPNEYSGAKIDLTEPTLALPYTAPSLAFLALAGGALAFYRWPGSRVPLALVAAALGPMSLALFAAIAISQRYTADFLPGLLVASAFGFASFATLAPAWQRGLRLTVTVLTVLAILISVATALEFQGNGVWGVPADIKARYQSMRQTADTFFGFTSHDR